MLQHLNPDLTFIIQMIFYCDIRNSGSLQDSEIRFLSNYKGEILSKWTKGIQWVDDYLVPLIIMEAELSSAFFS